MISKHYAADNILHLSQPVKTLFTLAFFIFTLSLSTLGFTESALTYGPTKSGETLWKIAKKNLPNNSLSIEQVAYAIYSSNPNAFQSGNINALLRDVTLSIPRVEAISKISNKQAQQEINQLQINAKKLLIAKINSKKFNKQIRKYQKSLKRHRRNTTAWKKTYRRLTRSKRNLAVSKKEIAHINTLFRKKNNLKPNNATNPDISKNDKIIAKTTPSEKKPSVATVTSTATLQTPKKEFPTNTPTMMSKFSSIDWLALLKNEFILIGATINGLILLFVLFKLFEKKKEEEAELI